MAHHGKLSGAKRGPGASMPVRVCTLVEDPTDEADSSAVTRDSGESGMSAIIKRAQASNKAYRARDKSKKLPPPKTIAANVVKAFDKLLEMSEVKDVPAMGPAFDKALDTTTEDVLNFLKQGGKPVETSLTEGVGDKYGIRKQRSQSLKKYVKHLLWILVCSEQDITAEPSVADIGWTLT